MTKHPVADNLVVRHAPSVKRHVRRLVANSCRMGLAHLQL